MHVYNIYAKEFHVTFPGDTKPGDVWLVDGVGKLIICHGCRKFIERNVQYAVWTMNGNLSSANPHHLNCIRDDEVVDAITELIIYHEKLDTLLKRFV